MRPMRMTAIIGGKRYNTDKSVLIADSVSPERGRPDQVDFLFRSDAGDYFVQHRVYAEDCYSGARDWVQPLAAMDAVMLYWELPEKLLEFEAAFPS